MEKFAIENMVNNLSRINLHPAKWIWYPSQRMLPNTFVLFRKEFILEQNWSKANCYIVADSRYLLTINGNRIGWGPAPCDPRCPDVDTYDVTKSLVTGKNIIAITVLYYGLGDGTWVTGKPGLLFNLNIDYIYNENSNKNIVEIFSENVNKKSASTQIVSDETWMCTVDRAHRPANLKDGI